MELNEAQTSVVAHSSGPLRVVGGPGTGKTTTLVEAAVAVLREHGPESYLLLTYGRQAAADLRARIIRRFGRTVMAAKAHSFHAYAFGLLRKAAVASGRRPPRLLSGPEQDVVIRELLAGDRAGHGVQWAQELRPVIRTRAFAEQLRDLLLRAYERGIDAVRLDTWAHTYNRPEWKAAARFLQQYADITELADADSAGGVGESGTAYDPAELIRAACALLRSDEYLLRAERERLAAVFVDEYQDIDPAQEELLRLIAGDGRRLVVCGDPAESIFGFRGADPDLLRRFDDRFRTRDGNLAPTVSLTTNYRADAQILESTTRVADFLRGSRAPRSLRECHSFTHSDCRVTGETMTLASIFPSASQESAYVADHVRKAHLLRGIDYSKMCVIVRSGNQVEPMRRALADVGVPVRMSAAELPLALQPAARLLLTCLRCVIEPGTLDEETATFLVTSPLGDADALTLRRLRAELQRLGITSEPLATALSEPQDLTTVDERWSASAIRVSSVLQAGRNSLQSSDDVQKNGDVEEILWAIWQASGLAERWMEAADAGGPLGAAADRDLDAVIVLFDAARRFREALPAASPALFLERIHSQDVPGDSLSPTAQGVKTVEVLTAHSVKGREWDVVVVSGVQEGVWPNLRLRGSLLGVEDLVELAAGRPLEDAGRVTRLLDEERRLFYVAVTRAAQELVVTAVADEDERPSRFLDELDPLELGVVREYTRVPRATTLPALVAELRSTVEDGSHPERDAASRQLAALAEAGVPGADPSEWLGISDISDTRPLAPRPLSPSSVESVMRCGLRWLLERCGGRGETSISQDVGLVVHEVAAALPQAGSGMDRSVLLKALETKLDERELGAGWVARQRRAQANRMADKLADWLTARPHTLVAVEEDFTARLGEGVILRGRVDRLEKDAAGRAVIVDFKTGKSAPTRTELADHPQLGMYQLAADAGGFVHLGLSVPGGAALVQLGTSTKKVSEQAQPALSEADDPTWARQLALRAVALQASATFVASENSLCRACPVRTSCPLHASHVVG